MLEKLLVDIRCDADFDYLGGGEAFRMLENAIPVNGSRRFRVTFNTRIPILLTATPKTLFRA
jgi:hypothetical protein